MKNGVRLPASVLDSDPLNRLRPIVLIDPDPDGLEWLTSQLIATGRPIRGFSDAEHAKANFQVGDAAVVVVAIGHGTANLDHAEESSAQAVREAACWIRASHARPALLALARRALAPNSLVAALHRGATSVITVDQIVILRELVEAQLRARQSWEEQIEPPDQVAYPHSSLRGEAPGMEPRIRPSNGANSLREVTLTPRILLKDLPVNEPGWIPRPVDFQITDDDPIDLKLYESKAVLRAIAAADGNRTLAAQLLGIGKSTLYRRLSEWRATLG
ncbi:Bacterial regulatory protein, Fis family [Planctomycetes bacterium Poly30]|uniref:Bacterial regulatory protein, Fis family n=1 Tax=Saltatorellus ferox TaxID=2528018 RepID=A0A518F088_9BACT|nr:Bacterial regulatory protein, Fis family [Planctomycetes bacterium Poly30]